jgi:hypothetical protein
MQVQFQGTGMPLSYGALFIKPVYAQLTHDTDFFSTMSPFIIFANGTQKVKSSVCQGGGKNPKWGDQIEINASSQDRILIELFDHHTFSSNEVIAVGEIFVSKVLASGGNYQDYIPLFYKGQPSGTLMVQAQFIQSQTNTMGMNTQVGMNIGGTQVGMNVGGTQMGMQPTTTFVQGQPTQNFAKPTTGYGQGGYQQGGYQQGGYQQGGYQQGGFPQTQTTFTQGSGFPQQQTSFSTGFPQQTTVIQGGGFPQQTTFVQQPTVTETIQIGGGYGGFPQTTETIQIGGGYGGYPQTTETIQIGGGFGGTEIIQTTTSNPNVVVEEVIIEQPKHHHHHHHGGGGGGFNVQYY